VKVHGVNLEIFIQAKQFPNLELNLVSTENEYSLCCFRMIYHMISYN